jgi:hypothetical protein
MEDLSRSYSSGSSSFNFCMSRSLSSLRLHGEENMASSPSSLHDETFSDAKHPQLILEKMKVWY